MNRAMNAKGLGKKSVKQRVKNLGNKTGSDHLFDDKKEHGTGRAVKRAKRLKRKPE